jgi:hypothetical protein
MGFVPRRGVNYFGGNYGPWFRPRLTSKWLRQVRPHLHLDIYANQEDNHLEGRFAGWYMGINAQDGSSGEVGFNRTTEDIVTPFTISNTNNVRVLPGHYDYHEMFYFWNMSATRRFAIGSRVSVGEFYGGDRRSFSVGPVLRANEHFNASLNFTINDFDMPTASFTSKLMNGRMNYNFNTQMFLNALVQYNSDTRQWTSNLRFNLIHRPLSDFFLVYNERRDEQTGRMLSRAVIAKLTYPIAL